MRRELRLRRPWLIVDDSRGKPYALPRTPTLRAYVARYYERVAVVDGSVFYARVCSPGG